MDKPTVLAVDGDIIAFKTAAICEDHWDGACRAIIDTTLKNIASETKIGKMRVYLSGDDNFRYEVAKTKPYKGNRATMVRPQYLEQCKEYLIEKYDALRIHGYEADDGIATDMVVNGAAHCGIDKDILQVPGHHYNYIKKEWTEVTEDEAIITLFRQVLMGDTSDNIPGLPGIGPAKAAKVIKSAVTAITDSMAYYEEVCRLKLPEVNNVEYYIEQLKLVRMVTDVKMDRLIVAPKDVDVYDFITTYIKPETEGFEEHNIEGAFV